MTSDPSHQAMPNTDTRSRPKGPWTFLRSSFQRLLGGIATLIHANGICLWSFVVGPKGLDPWMKLFSDTMLFLAGLKIRVHGLEHLDKRQSYLMTFNHINFFDHFAIYSSLNIQLRGVEKAAHFKWPVYGWFLSRIGMVPIEPRGHTQKALHSLEEAKQRLKEGFSIGMAPEGTRSKTGRLQPFKKGAFHLAQQVDVPLLPVVLKGMDQFNLKGEWNIHPTTIDLYIEKPLDPPTIASMTPTELRDHVHALYARRLSR